MTCQESVSLGAYVLGALEPAERSAMERHLAGCRSCRDELLSFAPLPGLLRHTPFEELPEVYEPLGTLVPVEPEDMAGDTSFEPFGARPNGGRRSGGAAFPAGRGGGDAGQEGRRTRVPQRRPPRRRRALAISVVAAAACASAVFVVIGPHADGDREESRPVAATTLTASDPDTQVTASAALTPKAWGTAVELKLSGLPRDVRCSMVVHARSGRSETAGSWGSGYYHTSTIPASTSLAPEDIARIDIVSDQGDLLVSLPRVRSHGGGG